MSVNFNSALMRSKAIASLDHASFRVYFVLQQHCVELRSTRIATPSFTQLHSAIAPECGGISIGMFRKSLLSLESAGFLKLSTNGRVKIFDLLGVRESYPDVAWFDRAVLILEEGAVDCRPEAVGNSQNALEGSPEGVSTSPLAHDSSIRNHQSSLLATPTDAGHQTACSEGLVADSITQGPSSSLQNLRTPDAGRQTGLTGCSPSGTKPAVGPAKEGTTDDRLRTNLGKTPSSGSSSDSSAQANPTSVTTVGFQADAGHVLRGKTPASGSCSETSDLQASQNPSLPLRTSVNLCDLCGKTPSSGSSSDSSAQANPTSANLCVLRGKTPASGSCSETSDLQASQNPSLPLRTSANLCVLRGKTPSSGSSPDSKAHLPLATQKALLEDLRKRTAAVLARVHRDFPQSRPIRWGSQDPSSPFDDENADAVGSSSENSALRPPASGLQPDLGKTPHLISPPDRNSSIIIQHSAMSATASGRDEVPLIDLTDVDSDLLEIPTGQYAIHLRNCGKLPPISESSCHARLSA